VKALTNGALTKVLAGLSTAFILGGVALYGEVRANGARTQALEHVTVDTLESIESLRASLDAVRAQLSENNGYLRRLADERAPR
jgi:hypothetical protein